LVVSAVALGLAGLAGCSSASAPGEKDDVDSYESELRLSSPRYLGQIADGETKTNHYTNPPRYRAYGFLAKGGDKITGVVSSVNGDGMGWITTTGYTVYAANDDASKDTLDAKVVYEVPAGTASRWYRIVFRDYDLLDATFNVTLSIESSTTSCTYDGDTYAPGASFPSTDGCNTCSCAASGSVACTKKACITCDPAKEPNRNYIGDPSSCETIRYTCKTGTHSFQNDCGCGCETN
jgi:hypothetical protein